MVVASLWVMATMIPTVLILTHALLGTSFLQVDATKVALDLEGEKSRTVISMQSPTQDCQGAESNLTILVDNTGSTTLQKWKQMDVIAEYTKVNNKWTATWLQYVDAPSPSNNEWTYTALNPDTRHPGLWNPDEQATIELKLVPPAKNGVAGTVILATPNGTTDAVTFQCT